MPSPTETASILLKRLSGGDPDAARELVPIVYAELHKVAKGFMGSERRDHTLQPTALVNEAWMRLVGGSSPRAEDQGQFVRIAARAMREVLIDHARRKAALKREGPTPEHYMDSVVEAFEERSLDVLALHEALDQLAAIDEELARIVELRFFGGLSVPETASTLGVSVTTIERRWRQARAWLRSEVPPRDGRS